MGKNREKIKSCHHKVDIRKSSTFQETTPKNDNMQIGISGDTPQFLIEANAAVTTGEIERARELVNDQGVEKVRQIIQKNPSRTDIMLMLAVMLHRTGQLDKAEDWFKRILEVEPNALVYNELAVICDAKGCFSEGIECLRKAMELNPDIPAIWSNLAKRLMETGAIEEGISLFRKAVENKPGNSVLHSNLLLNLHFLPDIDFQELFEEHKRWAKIHAPLSKAKKSHNNDPNPDRRLRVGYISPDFKGHSVTYYFEPLLDGHDRQAVEVYGYGNVESPDHITKRLTSKFGHYRNIRGLDDEKVAGMIEQDRIDILVDLAGHTRDNSLLVLARKPAPIQVTYMGYVNTTGMEQIDYFLTDELSAPPKLQKYFTEELVYLPDGYFCYRPPDIALAVTPLPAFRKGYITFGAFCNNVRISSAIMAIWADVLKANNKAHILLKFYAGGDPGVREYYWGQFERLGIPRERVEICPAKGINDILCHYGEVDIMLDTCPANGFSGIFHSMWMGVPTISLAGGHLLFRMGLSVLSRAGLEFFAAKTPAEYIAKATALANKPESLAKIRAAMRQRMADSIILDEKRFTRNVETAYRRMWHKWCQCRSAVVADI